jgi:hypothetical protein
VDSPRQVLEAGTATPRLIVTADDWLARKGYWYVVDPSGCWLWTRCLDRDGYGNQRFQGRLQKSHRVSYQILRGPIPPNLTIDHLCRVRHCVNPEHMECVTPIENVMRGEGVGVRFSRATHCVNGHEFTTDNTLVFNGGRYRCCRMCAKLRMRRRRATDKESLCRLTSRYPGSMPA